MVQGKFIVFEGGDKSGKSTQIKLAYERLVKNGYNVLLTREPGGKNSLIAEQIRSIILDKENTKMDKRAELLLFLAARAQHVAEIIKPALAQGQIVLCDRFDGSTFAYQGAARHLQLSDIKTMNNWAKDGVEPDLVVYLDISYDDAQARVRDDKHDRLDNEARSFHEAVRSGYLEQTGNKNWVKISALGTVEAIADQINQVVDKVLV